MHWWPPLVGRWAARFWAGVTRDAWLGTWLTKMLVCVLEAMMRARPKMITLCVFDQVIDSFHQAFENAGRRHPITRRQVATRYFCGRPFERGPDAAWGTQHDATCDRVAGIARYDINGRPSR